MASLQQQQDGGCVSRFFESTPVPADIKQVAKTVQSFMSFHKDKENYKIAFITSGGTTVPLEKQTVRYLDNFSTGSRGAISAEQFISQGYAVIFLHRSSSLRPFHRHMTSSLDLLEINSTGDVVMTTSNEIKPILLKYKEVISNNMLCMIQYTSLFDFIHYMKTIVPIVNDKCTIIYCAAAVSDFYINPSNMEEHKIHSSSSLTLHFEQVPKLLSILYHDWAPQSLVVSFKLETNKDILIESARKALKKYGHNLVVANCLETRKTSLYIVDQSDCVVTLSLSPQDIERGTSIEEKLIPVLCQRHNEKTKESS